MSNIRIAIILFIVFEIPVAGYAAIGAWRSRGRTTNLRTYAGMCAGIAMGIYAIARLMALVTQLQYGRTFTECLRSLETRSLVQTIIQTVPAYILAFAFTGDDHPGVFRRAVNGFLNRWR